MHDVAEAPAPAVLAAAHIRISEAVTVGSGEIVPAADATALVECLTLRPSDEIAVRRLYVCTGVAAAAHQPSRVAPCDAMLRREPLAEKQHGEIG